MRPPESATDDDNRGMSLVQLAAVHAALAEGFELHAVLEVEGVAQQGWPEAEVSWKARLVSDASEMERYADELGRQQDRLGRRVEPLEADVEAWISFLRVYQSHLAPFDLLTAQGLGLNDMSRLGRTWTQRFDADPELAKQAEELSRELDADTEKGEKVQLPLIQVGPAALSPSLTAGSDRDDAAPPAAQPTDSSSSAALLSLDQYAALSAELGIADEQDHEAVLARYGIGASEVIELDEAWRDRLESDKALRSDFRVLVGHYEQSARLRKRSAARVPTRQEVPVDAVRTPLPITAPPKSAPKPRQRTAAFAMMAPHVDIVPFKGAVREMLPIADKLPPRAQRRAGDIDATADVIPALLDSEIMPFESEADEEPPMEDDLDGTATLGAIKIDDEDVLPFAGTASPPPLSIVSILPDANPLDTTGAVNLNLVDSTVIPFEAVKPIAIVDDPSQENELDSTTMFHALDLGLDDEPEPEAAPQAELEPQPPSAPQSLSLVELASLHAELAVKPHEAVAIRSRYQLLDLNAQRQMEAYWQARFITQPHERSAYEKKFAEFRAWLLSHPR